MTTKQEVQDLLRLLTQEAKIPIAKALGIVKQLQIAELTSANILSSTKPEKLSQALSDDTKTARQIINAAKRSLRPKPSISTAASSSKSSKPTPKKSEVILPEPIKDRKILSETTVVTNRAPLVLAFAFVALSFSPVPIQPVSSRLSLAQGVVSLNSRSKAASLGLESGKSAEDEGWGEGFGRVSVLGRDVRTTRRNDLEENEGNISAAVWAVDLEALRKRNFSLAPEANFGANVPIHTPQAAKNYLLKDFDRINGTHSAKEKEENAAMVLGALELAMQTWPVEEVHARAWRSYVQVRPTVADGVEGWGAKGELKLKDILNLADGDKSTE